MIHNKHSDTEFQMIIQIWKKNERTSKGNFIAELAFFIILLCYALFGLTYDLKQLDYFMFASWIYYFLLSFRNEFEQPINRR